MEPERQRRLRDRHPEPRQGCGAGEEVLNEVEIVEKVVRPVLLMRTAARLLGRSCKSEKAGDRS